jgi:hypothetical protein
VEVWKWDGGEGGNCRLEECGGWAVAHCSCDLAHPEDSPGGLVHTAFPGRVKHRIYPVAAFSCDLAHPEGQHGGLVHTAFPGRGKHGIYPVAAFSCDLAHPEYLPGGLGMRAWDLYKLFIINALTHVPQISRNKRLSLGRSLGPLILAHPLWVVVLAPPLIALV